jgi:hypothetical protein
MQTSSWIWFLDYANNVKLYPAFQQYFRGAKPPLLAIRGKRDPYFIPAALNPKGSYIKSNCRWSDPFTQARNKRRKPVGSVKVAKLAVAV